MMHDVTASCQPAENVIAFGEALLPQDDTPVAGGA